MTPRKAHTRFNKPAATITGFFAVFFTGLLMMTTQAAPPGPAMQLRPDLADPAQQHITFRRIPANDFSLSNKTLTIKVNKSASFILLPLERVTYLNQVSFDWRSHGALHVSSSAEEASRDGDDARLRLGLLLLAEKAQTFDNPLAPRWLKTVRQSLRFPSDRLIYLVAGAQHPANSVWPSPYSDKATMIAIGSEAGENGWQHARYDFHQPKAVVGLWIMADGDNTGSHFTTELRKLVLSLQPLETGDPGKAPAQAAGGALSVDLSGDFSVTDSTAPVQRASRASPDHTSAPPMAP